MDSNIAISILLLFFMFILSSVLKNIFANSNNFSRKIRIQLFWVVLIYFSIAITLFSYFLINNNQKHLYFDFVSNNVTNLTEIITIVSFVIFSILVMNMSIYTDNRKTKPAFWWSKIIYLNTRNNSSKKKLKHLSCIDKILIWSVFVFSIVVCIWLVVHIISAYNNYYLFILIPSILWTIFMSCFSFVYNRHKFLIQTNNQYNENVKQLHIMLDGEKLAKFKPKHGDKTFELLLKKISYDYDILFSGPSYHLENHDSPNIIINVALKEEISKYKN